MPGAESQRLRAQLRRSVGNTPGGDPLKAINYPHQGESVTLPQGNVQFPLQGDYVSMPINVTPMQVTQWNLAYERQLPMDF